MHSAQNNPVSTADLAGTGQAQRATPQSVEPRAQDAAETDVHHEERAPLFPQDVRDGFKSRWTALQGSFIDDPRQAVRDGDQLVAEVMKTLAQSFADERAMLEAQFDKQSGQMNTEDLRLTLRRYRSFFDRLLSL